MLECWQNIQTCRHKYVVITVREEPARRQNSRPADQPNSQTNATEIETQTKSNWKASLPPRHAHIQILCIFPSSKCSGHLRGHFTPTVRLKSNRVQIGTKLLISGSQDEHLVGDSRKTRLVAKSGTFTIMLVNAQVR